MICWYSRRNKYLRGEKYVQSCGTHKINKEKTGMHDHEFYNTACATTIQQTFITIINNET